MNFNKDRHRKIIGYFNGQLTATDEAELLEWLKSDNKNLEYFNLIKNNLDPQKIEHPLLKGSYSELKSKIILNQEFISKRQPSIRKMQYSFSRIAALFVMALITGFSLAFLYLESKKSKLEVVWFETSVSRGKKSELRLPDGSKVWINSESTISYPNNFMEGNREVILKGEAYFEIAKFEGQPFIVKTNDYNIRVMGTKFNVMAYWDFERTETSLIEGNVVITKGDQLIPIEPGQTFTYENKHYSIKKSDSGQTGRWKDDVFDFERITFKELITRLERWYNIDIEIKNPELNNIIYSGVFKNEETIWQVLNTLQLTIPIRYSREGFRKIIIEKKR